MIIVCHKCKKQDSVSAVGRRDECSYCGADLHVCLNCSFYDVKSYNECSEPQADRVLDKDRANYCDYFKASDKLTVSVSEEKDRLRALADSLFKK